MRKVRRGTSGKIRKKPRRLPGSVQAEKDLRLFVWTAGELTRYHEAGHVVASLALDLDTPHRISAQWEDGSSGHVFFGAGNPLMVARFKRRVAATPRSQRPLLVPLAERHAQVAIAGYVAERIFCGKRHREYRRDDPDWADANTKLEAFEPAMAARKRWLKKLWVRTRALLGNEHVRRAVELVADSLHEYASLEGELLDAVLGVVHDHLDRYRRAHDAPSEKRPTKKPRSTGPRL